MSGGAGGSSKGEIEKWLDEQEKNPPLDAPWGSPRSPYGLAMAIYASFREKVAEAKGELPAYFCYWCSYDEPKIRMRCGVDSWIRYCHEDKHHEEPCPEETRRKWFGGSAPPTGEEKKDG